jgi:cytochrome c peroxidase
VRRGATLFFSDRLNCFRCHPALFFTDSLTHAGLSFKEIAFHDTGLENLGGKGTFLLENTGLYAHTGQPEYMGQFSTPSLRNVAVTAPYMHDGSVQTLSGVIDIYAAAGEMADLIAFLTSLTDETFLTDPWFSDPSK